MWKVLVAEDDAQNKKSLLSALNGVAEYTDVSTGKEALEAYQKSIKTNQLFDFILLDVTMPEMDGFETLKAIREEEERNSGSKEVRIIMITAYKDSLMEKYNMGWDDFITKPIEKDKLLAHMQALINPQT